jgi:hypothetical protein
MVVKTFSMLTSLPLLLRDKAAAGTGTVFDSDFISFYVCCCWEHSCLSEYNETVTRRAYLEQTINMAFNSIDFPNI